jgi:hypothetical protein
MTRKIVFYESVFLLFAGFTAYVIVQDGVAGFVSLAGTLFGSLWGTQLAIDFVLALTVALGFVVVDARARGLVWWPYAVLTLCLGSVGPLAYLARREWLHFRSPALAVTAEA